MQEVLYVQRFGVGFIANCISDNGVKTQEPLIDMRGAIVRPEGNKPGFYVFYGMRNEANAFGKYPLRFLCEGSSSSYTELIENMADDAGRMKASMVYCNMDGSGKRAAGGFYRFVWNHRSRNRLPFQVKPAVSPEDPEYGAALVREWRRENALDMPDKEDSYLVSQLLSPNGMVEGVDLKDPQWFAFHALRYLLAGYVKDVPVEVRRESGSGWGDRYDSTNILKQPSDRAGSLDAWT